MPQEELNGDPSDLVEYAPPPPTPAAPASERRPRRRRGQEMFQFDWWTFIQAGVGGAFSEGLFKVKVPEEYVSLDMEGDQSLAVIACPCGETPVVGVGRSKACNCNRIFLNIGRGEVRVFRPPEDHLDEPEPG